MKPNFIKGGEHIDERGAVVYNNAFNLSELNIKRCFSIQPAQFRAWHGHKKEQNWFMATSGAVMVMVVKPDNWENPSYDLEVEEFILKADKGEILHVPGGFVTGIKSITEDANLLVFSDFSLAESQKDDYRFDKERWYYETFM
jgi:dTDP-4-dehydrorhamnose 3,5-epimerase